MEAHYRAGADCGGGGGPGAAAPPPETPERPDGANAKPPDTPAGPAAAGARPPAAPETKAPLECTVESAASLLLSAAAVRVARIPNGGGGSAVELHVDVATRGAATSANVAYDLLVLVGDGASGAANRYIERDAPVRGRLALAAELLREGRAWLSVSHACGGQEVRRYAAVGSGGGGAARLCRVDDDEDGDRLRARVAGAAEFALASAVAVPMDAHELRALGGELMHALYSVWMKARSLGVDVAFRPSQPLGLLLERRRAAARPSAYPICLWRSWELCRAPPAPIRSVAAATPARPAGAGAVAWYECRIDVEPLRADAIARMPDPERATFVSFSNNFREVPAHAPAAALAALDLAGFGLAMRDADGGAGGGPRPCCGARHCCGRIAKRLILPARSGEGPWAGSMYASHDGVILRGISVHHRWDHADHRSSAAGDGPAPEGARIKVRPPRAPGRAPHGAAAPSR